MNNINNNNDDENTKMDFLNFLTLLGEATRRNAEKDNAEAFKTLAKFEKDLFDAYVSAGFKEEHALVLTKAKANILFSSVIGNKDFDPRFK